MAIDHDAEAEKALCMAQKAVDPDKVLSWLQVSQAWIVIGMKDEDEDEMPDSPDGFMTLAPIESEQTRIIIRLDQQGRGIVVCDPKFKQPLGMEVDSPAQAAEGVVRLFDQLEKEE